MADPRGFITLHRDTPVREPADRRVRHWREFYAPLPDQTLRDQGARCMDCGVSFCQSDYGCPVHNVIPEWNDLVRRGAWREASEVLHATNNFPEFTGRLCPAPCESACVLSIIDHPVAIRTIEQAIADRAFREGWITARPPRVETGRRVAIVGSGPAGLAAAQQLRRAGHAVTVFEKADRIGGLLRYGIPEFKLEKSVLERRLAQLSAEGVAFHTGVNVGDDVTCDEVRARYDALLLAVGAGKARDLSAPGRELRGVHLAMDYLAQQNRRLAGDVVDPRRAISARGKRVVIIGGGDTGSDCAGTALRQGATSVRQFELLAPPPGQRSTATPWPLWPMQLRTSHAHEEGAQREWSIATTSFVGAGGVVHSLEAVRVETRTAPDGTVATRPASGGHLTVDADLVLLAMGFVGVDENRLFGDLGVRTARGSVETDATYRTSADGVFVAGDARRGASLIVWAIREGRDAAGQIDVYLQEHAPLAPVPWGAERQYIP